MTNFFILFFHYIYNIQNLCDKVISNETGAVKGGEVFG